MDLLLAEGDLKHGELLYLDALSDLVAAYEDVHHEIEPASDADLLRRLMEAQGVTQAELSKSAGLPKSSISEVLAGIKPFSRQMIRKLADYLRRGRRAARGKSLTAPKSYSGGLRVRLWSFSLTRAKFFSQRS